MRVWLLAAMLILSSAHAWAQRMSDRVEGPGVKVGDTWMFNTLNGWNGELAYVSMNSVKEISAKGIALESSSLDRSSVSVVQRTSGFNMTSVVTSGRTRRFDPYYPNFAFPLVIGKTWRDEVTISDSGTSGETRARLSGKVIGWESVTVPAGTFRALRIELRGTYSSDGDGSGTIEDTLWYSPEVRNAVRAEYKDTVGSGSRYNHDIHELVRYWVGQKQ